MVNHVHETLNQFEVWHFFSLLEEKKEKAADEKKMKEEEAQEGQEILKKLQANLDRFKSAAGDKIIKYKEFWKENEEARESFDEGGSLYKMFDSEYIAGVLNLPDEALSEEEIDAQIEEIDKEKEGEGDESTEDKEESKEEDKEESSEDTDTEDKEEDKEEDKKDEKLVKESLDTEGLNLDSEEDEEKSDDIDTEETSLPDLNSPDGDKLGGSEEEVTNDEESFDDKSETREHFAVFKLSGGEREEVFRTDNPSIIKQFNDFYENSFKSCMKEQILKFKEAQETKRKEAELKAKQKDREAKKEKVDQFLKESSNTKEWTKKEVQDEIEILYKDMKGQLTKAECKKEVLKVMRESNNIDLNSWKTSDLNLVKEAEGDDDLDKLDTKKSIQGTGWITKKGRMRKSLNKQAQKLMDSINKDVANKFLKPIFDLKVQVYKKMAELGKGKQPKEIVAALKMDLQNIQKIQTKQMAAIEKHAQTAIDNTTKKLESVMQKKGLKETALADLQTYWSLLTTQIMMNLLQKIAVQDDNLIGTVIKDPEILKAAKQINRALLKELNIKTEKAKKAAEEKKAKIKAEDEKEKGEGEETKEQDKTETKE